jgi:hypothetical protein
MEETLLLSTVSSQKQEQGEAGSILAMEIFLLARITM